MKINNQSQTYIVLAVIIFSFYYLIIRPAKNSLAESLGLRDNADNTAVQNEVQKDNSPFATNLWHNFFYMPPAQPNGRAKISGVLQLAVPKMVKDLKKCFGILSDNDRGISQFFSRFKSQCEVSFFAQAFLQIEKRDLLEFLQKGFNFLPENGMSDKDINKLIKIVNNLKVK